MSLALITQKLLTLHPGATIFPPADGMLREWFNPAITDLFTRYAIEMPTMKAVRIEGPEARCHQTALSYCTAHPELTAWFGFCWLPMEGTWTAWLHSRSTDQALTTRYETDPTASHSTHMVALWWSRELYLALSKKPGVVVPDPLPSVFRRSVKNQPMPTGSRRWIESSNTYVHT